MPAMTRDVFEVRMDHPGRNALDERLMGWLSERFAEAGGRPVLLRGTTGAFSAGLDLRRVAALDTEQMAAFLGELDRLVVQLFEYPGPVVAAIEGHAIAGGCVLALCADVRVATADDRVRIGLNEVALGACFPPSVLRLARLRLPACHRERTLLGAELFPPREALRLGLVDEVTEAPLERAREHLGRLASHPPRTFALTKSVLRRGALRPTEEDERRFREEELLLWTSEELRERVRKVLAR